MQVQILPETTIYQVDNIVIIYYNIDINKNYSSISQLAERMTVNQDVTGSSPVRGKPYCRMEQLVAYWAHNPEVVRFKSHSCTHCLQVAKKNLSLVSYNQNAQVV